MKGGPRPSKYLLHLTKTYKRACDTFARAKKAWRAGKAAKARRLENKTILLIDECERLIEQPHAASFKANWFSRLGYVGVAACGAPQWVHTFVTGKAEGLSLVFIAALIVALILLQIGFQRDRLGRAYKIGNAAALFNALAMGAAWVWVWLKNGG
jgi:hypothetical protein